MPIRRMLPFLLINVVVSAIVVLTILYFWDGRQTSAVEDMTLNNTAVTQQAFDAAAAETPIFVPPTETPAPAEEGPTVHVVSAGDTLGIIAGIYDVTIEDIMAANDLVNPNILSVGQQLVIPLDGLPVEEEVAEEATALFQENVLPTPISTAAVPQGDNIVVEITAVIGVGQLENEAVQIRNVGTDPVALLGWKLADLNGRVYTFGQATLFGNSVDILVHTSRGLNRATDYYWGLEEAVWEPGELVTLLDSEDNIIATYEIPLQ